MTEVESHGKNNAEQWIRRAGDHPVCKVIVIIAAIAVLYNDLAHIIKLISH